MVYHDVYSLRENNYLAAQLANMAIEDQFRGGLFFFCDFPAIVKLVAIDHYSYLLTVLTLELCFRSWLGCFK